MTLSANSNPRRFRRKPNIATSANTLNAVAIPGPVFVGFTRRPGATLDGAIVATVSITFAVVALELNVTLDGETLHVLSEGNPEHSGASVNVPASPFIAVSVSAVLPACPGRVIVIDAGFATTEKSGVAEIVTVVLPEDPV